MNERKIIIFDIDGTLSDPTKRREIRWRSREEFEMMASSDESIMPMLELFKMCAMNIDADMHIWTARTEKAESLTDHWICDQLDRMCPGEDLCEGFGFGYHLKMRPANMTDDSNLKEQWLNEVGAENILFAIDDREDVCQMYQRNGVLALRVYKP